MAKQRTALESYIKHAEKFGTEEVFETALDEDLPLRDLATLALRLRNLNPRWHLVTECNRWFAMALLEDGVEPKHVQRITGISTAKVKSFESACLDEKTLPETALRRASNARFLVLKGIVRG